MMIKDDLSQFKKFIVSPDKIMMCEPFLFLVICLPLLIHSCSHGMPLHATFASCHVGGCLNYETENSRCLNKMYGTYLNGKCK